MGTQQKLPLALVFCRHDHLCYKEGIAVGEGRWRNITFFFFLFFFTNLGNRKAAVKNNSFLNSLIPVEEITSYGVSRGTDSHLTATDIAKNWSDWKPLSFFLWLQNHSPVSPFASGLFFFSLSQLFFLCLCLVPAFHPPVVFWSIANSFFPSLINLASCFHHSVWQCFHIREHLMLPCHFSETVSRSPHWFLFALPFDSRLYFHLEKKCQTLSKTQRLSCLWLGCHIS